MNPRYRLPFIACFGSMASLCALIGFVEAGSQDRLLFLGAAAIVCMVAALSGCSVANHVYQRTQAPATASEGSTKAWAAAAAALGVALGPIAIRIVPPSAGAALVPLALFVFLVGMAIPKLRGDS